MFASSSSLFSFALIFSLLLSSSYFALIALSSWICFSLAINHIIDLDCFFIWIKSLIVTLIMSILISFVNWLSLIFFYIVFILYWISFIAFVFFSWFIIWLRTLFHFPGMHLFLILTLLLAFFCPLTQTQDCLSDSGQSQVDLLQTGTQ